MNELIPTTEATIDGQLVPTCNAREIHRRIKNKRKFADWIKARIAKYDFVENQDFVAFSPVSEKPQGGRPSTEYHVTLDMAKELGMVENNAEGKAIRRYFIRMEKEALANRQQALESKIKALESDNEALFQLSSEVEAKKTKETRGLRNQLVIANRRTKNMDTSRQRSLFESLVAEGVLDAVQVITTRWKYTVTDMGKELGYTTNKHGTVIPPQD